MKLRSWACSSTVGAGEFREHLAMLERQRKRGYLVVGLFPGRFSDRVGERLGEALRK